MRDSLGPAQFPQPLDMARLKEQMSNATCVPPAAVDGLLQVLQRKLHAFHFFELNLACPCPPGCSPCGSLLRV